MSFCFSKHRKHRKGKFMQTLIEIIWIQFQLRSSTLIQTCFSFSKSCVLNLVFGRNRLREIFYFRKYTCIPNVIFLFCFRVDMQLVLYNFDEIFCFSWSRRIVKSLYSVSALIASVLRYATKNCCITRWGLVNIRCATEKKNI